MGKVRGLGAGGRVASIGMDARIQEVSRRLVSLTVPRGNGHMGYRGSRWGFIFGDRKLGPKNAWWHAHFGLEVPQRMHLLRCCEGDLLCSAPWHHVPHRLKKLREAHGISLDEWKLARAILARAAKTGRWPGPPLSWEMPLTDDPVPIRGIEACAEAWMLSKAAIYTGWAALALKEKNPQGPLR